MTSISIGSYVFTIGLFCHGLVLEPNTTFLPNSRIITNKNVQLGCPTFFNSIDEVMVQLRSLFDKNLEQNTQDIIIENHKNSIMFPLFYDKVLYFNPNSPTDAITSIFNMITSKNKYEEGIYLLSIHKKIKDNDPNNKVVIFENIKVSDKPLNLMDTASWKILDSHFQKESTNLESLSKNELGILFRNIDTSSKTETEIINEKKNIATTYDFHIDKESGRIIETKLSTIIKFLSQYGDGEIKNRRFFNIYDFTCNGFSSLLNKSEREELEDKFKDLDTSMQISYGGKRFATKNKKKTKRYV